MCLAVLASGCPEALALFLLVACVSIHELVHATGGVDLLGLSCVEGVGRTGYFQLDKRIGLAFKFDCLLRAAGGAGEKHVTVGHVFEYYRTVAFGMNTFFHFCMF